jgi:Asp-tRNA(Asn)/Glu-tRNA(Gln) amidotransferase A subunit family amidase
LAALVRRRAVSPVEVVEAHLRRVEQLNPRLNAVVALAADALERAREAEEALAHDAPLGALHGVPVTVKDTIDVRGLRATAGSKARANFVPHADAPSVARLRAAGAVVIGKTNCAELALDYTSDNPVYGRTNNPRDLSRTPGGSSGGCAAAVGACLSAGSLGSDLAGSIRIPAHFCGVAGLRPMAGRVPGAGHVPPVEGLYALGASLGPLARNVADLELFYDALTSARGARTTQKGAPSQKGERELKGLRVAWYADDRAVPVTDEVREGVGRCVAALEGAGASAFEEVPPHVGRGTELWLALFSHATQRFVRATYAGREGEAGETARAILERAASTPAPTVEELLQTWEERDRLRAELLGWMETTPLVVAPVGAVAAFRHGEGRRFEVGGESVGAFRAFGYAQAFNVFDLPAACVPAGRTRDGLPVGVQIVGRPFAERLVLRAARAAEAALGDFAASSFQSRVSGSGQEC